VEYVRVPSLAPAILDPVVLGREILDLNILDLDVVREPSRRARGLFRAFARFTIAISIFTVAVIAALLIVRTLPTGWTDGTSGHATQADLAGPGFTEQTQAAVELRTQGAKEQPNSPRAGLVILRAPSGSAGEAIPLGLSLAEASGTPHWCSAAFRSDRRYRPAIHWGRAIGA